MIDGEIEELQKSLLKEWENVNKQENTLQVECISVIVGKLLTRIIAESHLLYKKVKNHTVSLKFINLHRITQDSYGVQVETTFKL